MGLTCSAFQAGYRHASHARLLSEGLLTQFCCDAERVQDRGKGEMGIVCQTSQTSDTTQLGCSFRGQDYGPTKGAARAAAPASLKDRVNGLARDSKPLSDRLQCPAPLAQALDLVESTEVGASSLHHQSVCLCVLLPD
jgi:hypothetical protein